MFFHRQSSELDVQTTSGGSQSSTWLDEKYQEGSSTDYLARPRHQSARWDDNYSHESLMSMELPCTCAPASIDSLNQHASTRYSPEKAYCPTHNDPQRMFVPVVKGYNEIKLDTVGEVVEFFRQLFENVEFLHEHYIAHRDIRSCHIISLAQSPRPVYRLRLSSASKRYEHEDELLATSSSEADASVPEFHEYPYFPHNPFPADVYSLGNLIRNDFLQIFPSLGFMNDLVCDMVQDDASRRPSMDQVVDEFLEIVSQLSDQQLAQYLRSSKQPRRRPLMRRFMSSFLRFRT